MKPTLKHKPDTYAFKDMMVNFAGGRPLSCDQLNFLSRHEKTLSSHSMDPLLRYYLKPYHKKSATTHSFLLPSDQLDHAAVTQLKRRLQILIKGQTKRAHVQFIMTPEQFLELRKVAYSELILYHGNQLLTGAPFYPGGIPYVLFFQWGNLFAVAKYVVLAEEKSLKSNVLIYIEDMEERELAECVQDYQHQHELELAQHPQLINQAAPQEAFEHHHSPYQIPRLTLSMADESHKEE